MYNVPITVPIINTVKTPLVSAESNPNLSITTATLVSRPIELVIPIVSFLNPKSNATGSAKNTVPKLPNSCKTKAGPTSSKIWND